MPNAAVLHNDLSNTVLDLASTFEGGTKADSEQFWRKYELTGRCWPKTWQYLQMERLAEFEEPVEVGGGGAGREGSIINFNSNQMYGV